ncbi:CHASE domain-containing sensor histidine kinase [Laspinema olomoucense]|uniref:CHASE domain-containing sensor histidine kinase n=1 Tax=Laspinema olomoucense TaxID=3231600 RepID=UPI0021BB03CA|nr:MULTISPECIES: CHASE domain-containing protein [unclassified Laspinema]MCT7970503.1 CHASE domain-containing protein [Laspinema sp. D3d]MCT7988503.1 CHASE domain-containing protein [Laspinema sp. D3a]
MRSDLSWKSAGSRRTWIPYFVLVVTLLLTALASYTVDRTSQSKERLRFQNAIERTTDSIDKRLDTYLALLRATRGLFAANPRVSREQFQQFIYNLELPQRYPGIQGIGVSVRVTPEQQERIQAEIQAQNPGRLGVNPESARGEYHAILYLEPLDQRNRGAIGYDMFSEPVRRAAMERARDQGVAAASGPVTLVQEIEEYKQAGFLIYLPIYRSGVTPAGVDSRRSQLWGFIYSPFRADNLFMGIFAEEQYSTVDFEIYDGGELSPEFLLHSSHQYQGRNSHSHHPRFRGMRTLNVAGRTWTIAFASTPEFDQLSGRNLVPYICCSGLIIASILFLLTRSQAQARYAAERVAMQLRASQTALNESEFRLRRLVDANIIGIIIHDTQGNIVEANDAFLNLLGYSNTAVSQVNWWDMTPWEYRPADEEAIAQMKATGSHPPFEKEYIRKDGTRVPVLQGSAYLGGTQELAVSFVLDLSENKQAQLSLKNSETRFRTLIEQSPLSTQILSPQGQTIQVNRAWEELWGITLAELGDYNMLQDQQLVEKGIMPYIKKAFEGESVAIPAVRYELHKTLPQTVSDTTKVHWVQAYMYPVKDRDGNIRQLVIVHEDITERQNLEAQLAARAEQLAQANRMKDEFLATLSHELRTPLNSMLGWSQLLQMRKLDLTTTGRALESIERNTKALTQLIEDLLDVSRMMTGQFRIQVRPVDLTRPIENAIASVQSAADAKKISICAAFDSEVTLVAADPARLQQLVWNLLSNAIKFTPTGGRVEVVLKGDRTRVQIIVRDTGSGIAPEFLPYLFERFRQADSAITRAHGGLGMGLAIVRHLVELHGGTIAAESPGLGQGATFIVTLPTEAILVPRRFANEPFEGRGEGGSGENFRSLEGF